jgi:hypothetical protein
MSTTSSNPENMTDDCIKLMREFEGQIIAEDPYQTLSKKPMAMMTGVKRIVALMVQWEPCKDLGTTSQEINVYPLRADLDKWARTKGISEPMEVDHSPAYKLVFRFVKGRLFTDCLPKVFKLTWTK